MTISPLLQNQINKNKSSNSEHDKIYQNLKKHANDVHPNAPKARPVEESLAQSVKSYIKDTRQDFANFSTTIKTGQMSDNNLGRLNDLGMKIGGLLIASYLAIHSKSKQESIMRFVGTGVFFASMKLWPKIFINFPAKVLHNVDIGKKYISAQGDKKDFYLDNQFLPWDITDIEDEKERRRHQKVALQNRTLWMATAGVSVPVMTALISNRLEPVVARLIALGSAFKVNHNSYKPDGIEAYIAPGKLVAQNEKEVAKLCEQYKKDPLNPQFAKELEKYMRVDRQAFKDPDCSKIIKNFSPVNFPKAIKEVWKDNAKHTFTQDEFRAYMKRLGYKIIPDFTQQLLSEGESVTVSDEQIKSIFNSEEIEEITKQLFGNADKKAVTFREIENSINAIQGGSNKVLSGSGYIQKWLKGIEWDNEDFFKTIQNYHKTVVPAIRTRISRYLKLTNPIVGSTADSVYTNAYSRTMRNLFRRLNYSVDKPESSFYNIMDYIKINILHQKSDVVKATNHISLQEINDRQASVCLETLIDYFKTLVKDVPYGSDEYHQIIHELTKTGLTYPEIRAAEIVTNPENIELIKGSEGIEILNEALLGTKESSITHIIHGYASEQKTNIDAIVSRPAICANFEARLKEGKIQIPKEVLDEQTGKTFFENIDIRKLPDALKVARKVIYEGCVSQTVLNNSAGSIDRSEFLKIVEALYGKEAFENEPVLVKQSVAKLLGYIKEDSDWQATDKYLANCDLLGLVKEYASNIYPGMTWLKKAGIAGAVMVGITLLAQPLFGHIRREFPKEKKERGVK